MLAGTNYAANIGLFEIIFTGIFCKGFTQMRPGYCHPRECIVVFCHPRECIVVIVIPANAGIFMIVNLDPPDKPGDDKIGLRTAYCPLPSHFQPPPNALYNSIIESNCLF